MLEAKQLEKRFRRKKALSDVDFRLEKGIYGLLGENGAGKTTLMRCMAGLYRPTGGQVCWDGENVLQSKTFRAVMGYLPQHFEGIRELKVRECLEYFGHLKEIPQKELSAKITDALAAVHLQEQAGDRVKTLSGGMLRRLGIAQAVLNQPEFLMFDEPTAGLDPKERLRFQNMIAEYKGADMTVVISTHIVSDIDTLCDYIMVMNKGRMLGIFTPETLAQQAQGKVYELSEEQYAAQKERCTAVKKTRTEDVTVVRVLSEKELDGKQATADMEDGYLWLTGENTTNE